MSDGVELLLMIGGHYGLRRRLDEVTTSRTAYTGEGFLALNDDVKRESEVEPTNKVMVEWMDEQWQTRPETRCASGEYYEKQTMHGNLQGEECMVESPSTSAACERIEC